MLPDSIRQDRLASPRPYPSVEEIDRHMRNGRRLRAEAMAAVFGGTFGWLLRGAVAPFSRVGAEQRVPSQAPADGVFSEAATPLRSPLMAIRSSAEILRDNPDLTPDQRARFVEILLTEEQRLERLIAMTFGGGRKVQGR